MLDLISTDIAAIVSRLRADYEGLTGRTLRATDIEYLLINSIANEIALLRQQMNFAANQMFSPFATGAALDNLAAMVATSRLPASGATVSLQFTLAAAHPGVVIPAGTRVRTNDGFIFSLTQDVTVAAAATTATGSGVATTLGSAGNGYVAGDVDSILDPQAYLLAVTNTDTSAGGADQETDDELRERIRLGPSQSSVAGPVESYIFHTRQASSSIIDVAVTSPTPGTVNVYPLLATSPTPPGILSLVLEKLSAEDVRPLTDTVVVLSPTEVTYNVEIEIVAYDTADVTNLTAQATTALQTYIDSRAAELGQDITRDQLSAIALVDSGLTYSVSVVQPAADVVIAANEIGRGTLVSVTVTSQTGG